MYIKDSLFDFSVENAYFFKAEFETVSFRVKLRKPSVGCLMYIKGC